jgi:hypothetical protein
MTYNDNRPSKLDRIKQILLKSAPREVPKSSPPIVIKGWFNRVTVVVANDRRDPAV